MSESLHAPARSGRTPARGSSYVVTAAVVVLVLVTVGALLLGGRSAPVAARPGAGSTLTGPAQRQLVCPSSTSRATTYVGRLPGNTGGTVATGPDGSGSLDLAPGARQTITDPARAPVTVLTTGAAIRGVFADRVQAVGGITRCGAPRASWWFTGAGANPAHHSRLVIDNPRPGPAVVDVSVYGAEGPVTGAGLRGVSVKSGERRVLRLADVAPSNGNLAVHVQVSRGLVVAAVEDQTLDVLDPRAKPASEWLPDQQAPGTHLVLNGLPSPRAVDTALQVPQLPRALTDGAGLVLSNPGETAAVARIRFSGIDGSRLPAGLDQQTIPPGSVITVPLAERLRTAGTAIVVDSDQPVTAGYVVPGVSDLVHVAAGQRWSGPAAAALPDGATSTLVLTADDGTTDDGTGSNAARDQPADARVVQLGAAGRQLADERVSVPARSTKAMKLEPRAASVVVTSDGTVVGTVLVARASTFSAVPLAPVLAALRVPVVRPGSD